MHVCNLTTVYQVNVDIKGGFFMNDKLQSTLNALATVAIILLVLLIIKACIELVVTGVSLMQAANATNAITSVIGAM